MSKTYPTSSIYDRYGADLADLATPPPPARPYARPAMHVPVPQTVSQLLSPATAGSREILSAHYVRTSYGKGPLSIPVLQGVELAVHQSEFVSIVGPSGCGKTTLLHLLATLDRPDAGEICFEGNRIDNLPAARARYSATDTSAWCSSSTICCQSFRCSKTC